MGLRDILSGRKRLKGPAAERLFALSTAAITLEVDCGLRFGGAGAVVYKPVSAGEFTAGQAYVHAAPVTHMAVNETPAVVEVTVVYFNLPHNAHPAPLVGNQTDAVNFGALPPADCPRLR